MTYGILVLVILAIIGFIVFDQRRMSKNIRSRHGNNNNATDTVNHKKNYNNIASTDVNNIKKEDMNDTEYLAQDKESVWWLLPKGKKKKGPFTLAQLNKEYDSLKDSDKLSVRLGDSGKWVSCVNAGAVYPELSKVIKNESADFQGSVDKKRNVVPSKVTHLDDHIIVDGSCTKCLCSSDAINAFGWKCKPKKKEYKVASKTSQLAESDQMAHQHKKELTCDVCGKLTVGSQGYALTTPEVLLTKGYWHKFFARKESTTFRNYNAVALMLAQLALEQKAWLVCDKCSGSFNFNKSLASQYSIKGGQHPRARCLTKDETIKSLAHALNAANLPDPSSSIEGVMATKLLIDTMKKAGVNK